MNRIEAYADLLLNEDAELAKYDRVFEYTSTKLFELGKAMSREEIKSALKLYNELKQKMTEDDKDRVDKSPEAVLHIGHTLQSQKHM